MNRKKGAGGRRQHARVTASDVAKLAGVSPMTVSRVINGEARVRDSTREAVAAAIKKLGYSPNKAARSLASANPIKIGLLFSNPSSTFLSAMLLGVMEHARQSDTQVFVVECATVDKATAVVSEMQDDGVDGILLAPPLCDSREIIRLLKSGRVPAVTIGAEQAEERVSSVNIDDYRASQVMTRYLLQLGHRRIGFIIGSEGQSASRLRFDGFRDATLEAGLETPSELIIQGEFSYRSGFEGAARLLALAKPPTAIIACNDDMAAGVIAVAHRHHLDVPRDLSVCGFDDTLLATTVWPEITTIRQPVSEMANRAISILESCIRRLRSGVAPEYEHVQLPFRLMERDSSAPINDGDGGKRR